MSLIDISIYIMTSPEMLIPTLDHWREKNVHPVACKSLRCCGKWMHGYDSLISIYENIKLHTVNIGNNWHKELLIPFLTRSLYKPSCNGNQSHMASFCSKSSNANDRVQNTFCTLNVA